ncbi:MAG: NAD(P)-binding domain-containing protein [Bacteroidota bacterium]
MTSQSSVAVFGLGAMGFGIASSLVRAGHRTYGVDLNPEAMARFQVACSLKSMVSVVPMTST